MNLINNFTPPRRDATLIEVIEYLQKLHEAISIGSGSVSDENLSNKLKELMQNNEGGQDDEAT